MFAQLHRDDCVKAQRGSAQKKSPLELGKFEGIFFEKQMTRDLSEVYVSIPAFPLQLSQAAARGGMDRKIRPLGRGERERHTQMREAHRQIPAPYPD